MTLNKILSFCIIVCLGLFGVGVHTLYASNVISGKINEGSFNLSYKLKLFKPYFKKQYHIICNVKDEGVFGKLGISRMNYEVGNSKWMHNINYVSTLLNKLKDSIVDLNGCLPSLSFVNNLSEKVEHVFESSESKDSKSQSNDSGSLDGCIEQNKEQSIEKMGNKECLRFCKNDDFLKHNVDTIKDTKCISFTNCQLNNDFVGHFYEMDVYDFDTIKFVNCALSGVYTFADILNGCNIENLSIINCGLTNNDLIRVLSSIGSTTIYNLDLSHNNLTSAILDRLDEIIYKHGFSIGKMNLSGNNDITNKIAAKIGGFVNDL